MATGSRISFGPWWICANLIGLMETVFLTILSIRISGIMTLNVLTFNYLKVPLYIKVTGLADCYLLKG